MTIAVKDGPEGLTGLVASEAETNAVGVLVDPATDLEHGEA